MSSLPSQPPSPPIQRRDGDSAWRPLAASVLLGIVGAVEVTIAYLAWRNQLPAQVPDHFDLAGQTNGTLPPELLLGLGILTIAAVTAVFLGVLWMVVRSPPLSIHHRPAFVRPLLIIQASFVVVAWPLVSTLLFASAAGVLPVVGAELGLATGLLGVIPLLATVAVLVGLRGQRLPQTAASPGDPAPAPAFLGVGGPIELTCSSCGQNFRLSGVPLLAPHMGIGGQGSLYVRCANCGERGWDVVVARRTP
jgi:hypothetical protein